VTDYRPHNSVPEKGFVLLAVIWLLVLAGSVTGWLMLRAQTLSLEAKADGTIEQDRRALEAAIDTVVADRIIKGGTSSWSRASAQGTINIDGTPIFVRSTGENGRLDLLRADLAYIDRALQGLGLGAQQRRAVLGTIAMARSSGRGTMNLAEIRSIIDEDITPAGSGPCLADMFTAVSHLQQPQADQMPEPLARALAIPGQAAEPGGGALLAPVAPQRIEASTAKGMTVAAVIRVIGQVGNGYQTLGWFSGRLCR